MASCRYCPCKSASCRDSRQEAKSHGQSLQEDIYQAQHSRQEARDRGQSRQKPNMTGSLCRMRKLADSFIPCEYCPLVSCLGTYGLQTQNAHNVPRRGKGVSCSIHCTRTIPGSSSWHLDILVVTKACKKYKTR